MMQIKGAYFDPSLEQYFLNDIKKNEVLKDLSNLKEIDRKSILDRIDLPLVFDNVYYYYYIPRWDKSKGYRIGLFFGDWKERNLFSKGVTGKPIAQRKMTVDEVIDDWARWRLHSINYDEWASLIADEVTQDVPIEFINILEELQNRFPLRSCLFG